MEIEDHKQKSEGNYQTRENYIFKHYFFSVSVHKM